MTHTEPLTLNSVKKHSVRYDGPEIAGIYIPKSIALMFGKEGKYPDTLELTLGPNNPQPTKK